MKSKMIPVINAERLNRSETLRALDSACRQWGAFQLVGHGINRERLQALYEEMQCFFKRPTSWKRLVSRTASNPWGFYDKELTKHTRDWKEIFDYGPPTVIGSNKREIESPFPDDMPGFRRAIVDIYQDLEAVAFTLLGAIATNLGVDPMVLAQAFLPQHTSFLRLNYYPSCPNTGVLGVNQHTDSGALTLLLQYQQEQYQQEGLEIFHEGQWYLVGAREDAILVHLGDIIQVWSNDRYCAPLHRAITYQDTDRFSTPFFFNPSYETDYQPLDKLVNASNPPRYQRINWGEFRRHRIADDYSDIGEEIQISRFKIAKENN